MSSSLKIEVSLPLAAGELQFFIRRATSFEALRQLAAGTFSWPTGNGGISRRKPAFLFSA